MTPWWQRMGRYARPHTGGIVLVTLLLSSSVLFDVLKPWPLKLLVDYVVTDEPLPARAAWIADLPGAGSQTGMVAWLALGTFVLFLLTAASIVVQRYVLSGIGSRMVARLGEDLFVRLQSLPLSFHRRSQAGDLVRRATEDTNAARELAAGVIVPFASAVLSLLLMFVIMVALDAVLAVVAIAMAIPVALVMRYFATPMSERAFQQFEVEGEMMALAEQTLTSLPVVQAFGREAHSEDAFRSLSQRTVRAQLRSTASELQFTMSNGTVVAIGTAIVTTVGGLRVIEGQLSLGGLLVFLAYLTSMYAPLETLAYVGSSWANAKAGARRVFDVMDAGNEIEDREGALDLAIVRGAITIDDVSFDYVPGRPTLRHVSLRAEPGQLVAVVGETGSGKSTLLSLLMRSADPTAGHVRIDGHDLRDLTIASLRSHIAVVLQDPYLLPLTIAENIAYGRPDASPADVRAAAIDAQADEFIRALPDGYDTVLGERGVTLSGGQRQRIAVARALLKDAPILLLDEPTAAVDAGTEASLVDALERLMAGRTTVIVTHRLSLIRQADVVVVVDQGRIVESGPPARLLAARGPFRRLHDLQFGAATEPEPERARRSDQPRLRIALVSQEYPPDTAHGGIASQTHLKAQGLAARGHEVHVISHSTDGARHEVRDGEVLVTRLPGVADPDGTQTEAARWMAWSAQVAAELAARHEATPLDLIDAPEYGAEAYVHLLDRPASARVPTVIHLQGPIAMLAAELGWPERGSSLHEVGTHMEGTCLRLADAVYSSSRCSAEWAARAYGLDVDRIPVAHVGVDTRRFRLPARRPQRPTIVFVGRLSRSKGAIDVVDAAIELASDIPDLRLKMVGRDEGGLAEQLRRRAAVAGYPDLLELTGPRSRDELPGELGDGHVFAAPSHYEGGPGFVYLEAMACGLPAIACAGSGAAEVVIPEVNGLLVPVEQPDRLAKALNRLLTDAEERHLMAARARRWVEEHADTEGCIDRIESLYLDLLQGRPWHA